MQKKNETKFTRTKNEPTFFFKRASYSQSTASINDSDFILFLFFIIRCRSSQNLYQGNLTERKSRPLCSLYLYQPKKKRPNVRFTGV